AEPRAEDVRTGRHPDGDVVAGLHALADQSVARTAGLARRVAVRPGLLLEEQERLVGGRLGPRGEQGGNRALPPGRELEPRGCLCLRHRLCNPELRSLKLVRRSSTGAYLEAYSLSCPMSSR